MANETYKVELLITAQDQSAPVIEQAMSELIVSPRMPS